MSAPRSRSLAGALAGQEELLSHCVHCGFCLPVCPTYQELGDEADSPRGRLHLMRAVVEGRLDPGAEAFQRHMDRCLGCRACETVCPSGVEYGSLLEHARAVAVEAKPPGLPTRILLRTMGAASLRAAFGAAGRVVRASGLARLGLALLPRGLAAPRLGLAMLEASAPPALGAPSHAGPGSPLPTHDRPPPGSRGRVVLLEGCVQKELFRRVNRDTRLVLQVNGWEVVEAPGQGCCGALHAHAGALDEAHDRTHANARAFAAALGPLRPGDRIGVNAAGCGAHLRASGDPAIEGRVRDVSELLAGDDAEGPLSGAPLPLRVVYDAPCHLLHAQGVENPPLRLLRAIPGLELLPLRDAERCCGGAGIYGVTHPELGGRFASDKVEAILASGAQVVATGNPGCQMQIGAALRLADHPLPVVHPVELLAESYRRAGWTE